MEKIKENKAQCLLCKDIIESKYRHDFVTCSCGNLSVDGGKDYIKRSVENTNGWVDLSTTEDEVKEKIEEDYEK